MFLVSAATTPVLNQVKTMKDAPASCAEQQQQDVDDQDNTSIASTVGTNFSDDESLSSCDEITDEYKIIPICDTSSRKEISSSSDSRKVELLLDNMEGFQDMLKKYRAGDFLVDISDDEEDEDDSSFF